MKQRIEQQTSFIPHVQPFVRDSFTWFAYIIMGYITYLQAALGPLTSLLRGPFHLNYIEVGLPTGAFAVGLILIGLFGERIVRPWRNYMMRWLWMGGGGVALGIALLVVSQNIGMVVAGALIIGVFGALLQFILQTTLAGHHQERRTIALTEANVVASAGAVLAPLFIGGFQSVGLSWRAAVLFAPAIYLLALLRFRGAAAPRLEGVARERIVQPTGFPLAFWLYWIALVCCVAIEWSIIVWSAVSLENTGVPGGIASMFVSVFFVAEMGGRMLGSRLARRASGTSLLMSTMVLTSCGFLLFWLSPQAACKIVGLLLTGVGVANLFPLTLALALGTVPRSIGVASARLSLGVGVAVLGAPLLLGWLANLIGVQRAYGLIIALLLIAGVLTQCASRQALRAAQTTECKIDVLIQNNSNSRFS
jgi:MFS family permease